MIAFILYITVYYCTLLYITVHYCILLYIACTFVCILFGRIESKKMLPTACCGVTCRSAPRVVAVTDEQRGVVNLTVADEDTGQLQLLQMCVKRGEQGLCLVGDLFVWSCFSSQTKELHGLAELSQPWSTDLGGFYHSPGAAVYYSAFLPHAEFRGNVLRNTSLSVVHSKTNEGRPALSWNLAAPCRLEAEVWPCRMDAGSGQGCGEVLGFRVKRNESSQWWENNATLWVSTVNTAHIQTRGEVLLLHASGADVLEAGLVCQLGTELSELGFGVSLDLWSQAELSSLGPGPWLHSKLGLLQRRRGKALLVLSGSALDTAQACWDTWCKPTPCFSDVFGSALSCIFSAHLKGGTAERFVLVHFDSQKLINGGRAMPMLFQGLELYSLPSESRQLLAELCPEQPESFSMRIKKLLWLRRASRHLTKGLKNSGKRLWPQAQSVLTQVEILEEETLPLHM
uniref:SEFIR domain-containing protein n=1 Tax=Pygocentrus nattereri TaxID=42514 RepID=A0AAR2LSQ2_PYGNA